MAFLVSYVGRKAREMVKMMSKLPYLGRNNADGGQKVIDHDVLGVQSNDPDVPCTSEVARRYT